MDAHVLIADASLARTTSRATLATAEPSASVRSVSSKGERPFAGASARLWSTETRHTDRKI